MNDDIVASTTGHGKYGGRGLNPPMGLTITIKPQSIGSAFDLEQTSFCQFSLNFICLWRDYFHPLNMPEGTDSERQFNGTVGNKVDSAFQNILDINELPPNRMLKSVESFQNAENSPPFCVGHQRALRPSDNHAIRSAVCCCHRLMIVLDSA